MPQKKKPSDKPISESTRDLISTIALRRNRWRELMKVHFSPTDNLTMTVLKGHLLLEQQLTAVISHCCHESQFLEEARFQFTQKIALARALVHFPFPDEFWMVLTLVNKLRNAFAHELEPKKLGTLLEEARRIYELVYLGEFAAKIPKPSSDLETVTRLISYWYGFMTATDSVILVMEKHRRYGPIK